MNKIWNIRNIKGFVSGKVGRDTNKISLMERFPGKKKRKWIDMKYKIHKGVGGAQEGKK